MSPNLKAFQKLPSGWNKKQVNFKNLEGGEVQSKKKGF
jgi:hypothetical protein